MKRRLPLHPDGVKKLEVGGSKNPMIFIVALTVLIAAGGGFAVWVFLGGNEEEETGTTDPSANFEKGVPHQCAACEAEFRMTAEDFNAMGQIDRSLGVASRLPHCPQCNAKHAGLAMVACLKCRKLFVPYGLKVGIEVARSESGDLPPGTKNVCPHCQTDQDEYSSKRWKKK